MAGRVDGSPKGAVRAFWDAGPCGTRDVTGPAAATAAFFAALDARRYALEPFIERYARFEEWASGRVLEIGCGAGGDLARFARGGAVVAAVDLSARSVELTRRRLALEGLEADVRVADAEALPFADAGFADVLVEPVLTPWDARLARRWFLPRWCRACLPARWGWFLVIRARKP